MQTRELATRPALAARSGPLSAAVLRPVLVIAAYIALFLCALPALLWQLGRRLDTWLALGEPSALARGPAAVAGAFAGVRVVTAMAQLSRRGEGLPISHLPPQRLVASGLYTRLRHPIYVWFTLSFTGITLALGSSGAALGSGLVLLLAWVAYARAFEEPRLHARFGAGYAAYARATWLICPLPSPWVQHLLQLWRVCTPALERLANRTVIFRTARWSLVSYGAWVGLGAFVMTLWSSLLFAGLGVTPDRFAPFAVSVGLAMLAGGRLAGVCYRWRLLVRAPGEALRTIGFVSWGGYAGMCVAAALSARQLGLPFGTVIDRLVLPGLLCSAIGRLGCLSYGCCGGRAWPYGLCWRSPDARVVRELGSEASVPRIPTQLMSGALALIILAALVPLTACKAPAGAVTALAALLYGLGRVSLEATREEARFGQRAFTRGQLASLALASLGLVFCLQCVGGPSWPSPVWHARASDWLTAMPVALVCGLLTFVATGIHGPRVGHW